MELLPQRDHNDNCGTELPPATFCTGDVQSLHTRNFSSLSLAAAAINQSATLLLSSFL
jgi:hypothetical protein